MLNEKTHNFPHFANCIPEKYVISNPGGFTNAADL
jgi:hypothetical protein